MSARIAAGRALRLRATAAGAAARSVAAAPCAPPPALLARSAAFAHGARISVCRPSAATCAARRAAAPRRSLVTAASATVQKGDGVGVNFTATASDGRVVDSSESRAGAAFFICFEDAPRVPGLDTAVLGLSLGGRAKAVVAAADAFGVRSEDNIIRVPGSQAPTGLEAGDTVRMGDGRPGVVTSATKAEVVVDVNHEFAGMDITIEAELIAHTPAAALCRATFGQGCFWSPELRFQRVPGVMSTSVGYANGFLKDPTYEAVCSGTSGHVEAVQVAYDPGVVSYDALLALFWASHDPTQLNRQGNDVGTQYRSGIYAHDEAQLAAARASAAAEAAKRPGGKVATEVVPLTVYYKAEEYHQSYLAKGGRNGNAQSPAKMCNDPVRCYG